MRARSCLILIVASTLLAASAHADKKRDAARHFKKAKALFKERSYIEAISNFEKAYTLRPHFFVQCSIARCYENMNDFIRAAARYRRCLDEGAAKAKMAERVRQSLEAVEKRIAKLEVKSPGAGGTIFVDGNEAGQAPGTIPLNPGRHAIEVRREGAMPARASVESSSGGSMSITLVPRVLATPKSETKIVKVIEAASRPAPPESKPERRGLHPAYFWSTLGVTAALGAVMAIFGTQTITLRDDYEKDPTKEGYDDFKSRRTLTNIFVGLTAAAAAGATTLFFFTDFGGSKEQRDDTLSLGIGLRGRF